jgi:hypothetical protein
MNEKRGDAAIRDLAASNGEGNTLKERVTDHSGKREAVAAQSTERDRPLTRHTLAGTPGGRK